MFLIPQISYACSACFYGNPEDPANKALRMGIMAMLVVLLGVMAAFIAFFISFMRKTKGLAQKR